MVDLIAGTSTGGAAGLRARPAPAPAGRPMYTAKQLAQVYVTDGPTIFSRSLGKTITSGRRADRREVRRRRSSTRR